MLGRNNKRPPWLRRVLFISGIALVIVLGFGVTVTATSSPEFCASCHEMQPEYLTWQASSHAETECVACHVGPGLKALLADKAGALVQVYGHFTGSHRVPIAMSEPLPDKNCTTCHQDLAGVTGEIKIPHERHLAQGVACVTCHGGVAHGWIATRGVTSLPAVGWTQDRARSEMEPRFTKPNMVTCVSCHQDRGIPVTCATCHRLPVP